MQENAYITAEVNGKIVQGFYTSTKAGPAIRLEGEGGVWLVDPDSIRYLGEPR